MTKPFYISVTGTMGSGKTTASRLLAKELGFHLVEEVCSENAFLSRFYKKMNRWAFHSQTFFLMEKINQLMEIGENLEDSCHPERPPLSLSSRAESGTVWYLAESRPACRQAGIFHTFSTNDNRISSVIPEARSSSSVIPSDHHSPSVIPSDHHSPSVIPSDRRESRDPIRNKSNRITGIVQDTPIEQDVFSYAKAQHTLGNMDDAEWKLYKKIYTSFLPNLPKPDLLVYLKTSLPVVEKRIEGRGRGFEQKIPRAYLELLERLNEEWIRDHKPCRMCMIDTDGLNIVASKAAQKAMLRSVMDTMKW